MKPAIRVQKISKCYQVGSSPTGDLNLSESIRRMAGNTWRKVQSLARPGWVPPENGFWAVKDAEFEVQPGEALGVIGRNGAGKSTLFKLLSRITEPTEGRLEIRGRLGSLLEVGTGFHPELSGRENVYMNGSILGMSRREINAKFDRIVEFSEVGRFLDTPVKRYSSGMYVRLAFAVAAHLEPEILIVDEVLAVGDAPFQKRCLDRMLELSRSGKTILFVSHNMQQIPRLCDRAIMMERGRVIEQGPAAQITQSYMDRILADASTGDLRDKPRTGDGRARFHHAGLVDSDGQPVSAFTSGDNLTVRMDIESSVDLPDIEIQVILQNIYGMRVITGWSREAGFPIHIHKGQQSIECRLSKVDLRPGHSFILSLSMMTHNGIVLDAIENAALYEVNASDAVRHLSSAPEQGIVLYPHTWHRVGEA